ncbi:hypothetical protein V2K65_10285 [Pseudomonas alliivorans]|nr:hypothetical protein [Pseudomonas alliivorans]
MDLKHMPEVAIECVPGSTNVGLELVDIYLWLFKRFFEGKALSQELKGLIEKRFETTYTDQLSIAAIKERWRAYFSNLPPITQEEFEAGQANRERAEQVRRVHLDGL